MYNEWIKTNIVIIKLVEQILIEEMPHRTNVKGTNATEQMLKEQMPQNKCTWR